jgi:hypothetical protein
LCQKNSILLRSFPGILADQIWLASYEQFKCFIHGS